MAIKMKKIVLFLFIPLLIASFFVSAESAYIYDKDRGLWSRTGPSKEYKVSKKYPPGTKLQIVDGKTENGFTQIMDKNGFKSWILSNYLLPSANINLDKALVEIEQLKLTHQAEIKRLQAELSARAPLEETNRNLQAKIAQMQIELDQLTQSNDVISSRFNREVFFAGGLTIFIGILFGWVFAARGRKRNDAWG